MKILMLEYVQNVQGSDFLPIMENHMNRYRSYSICIPLEVTVSDKPLEVTVSDKPYTDDGV